MRGSAWLRLGVVAASLLLCATFARAATVVIVRPLDRSAELNESLSRLQGELLSVGFEVALAGRPAIGELGAANWLAWLQETAAARGASAVIDVPDASAPFVVDVWVVHESPRRLELARVSGDPKSDNASERLAIRAIEALRASFLEIELEARDRRSREVAHPITTTASQTEAPKPAHPQRFGVEVGAAVVTGLDGVGPALLPVVGLDWAATPNVVVKVTGAGLGSRATVATTAGNARVAQQYGVLGASYRWRAKQAWRPFVSLAAGVLRTSIDGQADSPKQGRADDRWSFLGEGSLGIDVHLGDRYDLAVAAHAQLAQPYVAIHFVDTVVATSGRPNLLLTLTVAAWL